MIRLPKSLQAWGSDAFTQVLKQEVMQLGLSELPLQQGLRHSSYASDESLSVIVLNSSETRGHIRTKLGLGYTGIVSGCHCADDPSPNNEYPEYCEVEVTISKPEAVATIRLLDE